MGRKEDSPSESSSDTNDDRGERDEMKHALDEMLEQQSSDVSNQLEAEFDRQIEEESRRISDEISRAIDEQLQEQIERELEKAAEHRRKEIDRQLDEQFEKYMDEKLQIGMAEEEDFVDLPPLDATPASVETINSQIQRIVDQYKAGKISGKIQM